MDEQRAEFEAWASRNRHDIARMLANPAIYDCNYTQVLWEGWEPATQRQQERIAELQAQVSTLTTALSECRDAFPIPEPGAMLEHAWMGAMTDPEDVPPYVKAQVQALSLDADRYQFATAYNEEGRLNFKAIYDAWDGDGSFTDQIDAAIARATHKEQT